jgi:hypothetical protein
VNSGLDVDVGSAGNPPPGEIAQLKGRILDMVRQNGSVTFAELSRLSGFEGDETLFAVKGGRPVPNVVLWSDVSRKAVVALKELLTDGKIIIIAYDPGVGAMTYGFDGKMLALPLARSLRRGYQQLRWLPTFITTPRWMEICEQQFTRPHGRRPRPYGDSRSRGRVGRVAKQSPSRKPAPNIGMGSLGRLER